MIEPFIFQNKPFALSIGPQRAATSWIDKYLRARGDVCLPHQVKEIFFFDRHFDKGPEFYKSHFKPGPHHDLIMEVSATYFDCPQAPERIKQTLGTDIRLICPLRAPIARSYSLYKHYLRYGIVTGSLEEAVKQKPQIIESSRYADHLSRWFEEFGRENITILFQEDLDANPEKFVSELCQSLGLKYRTIPDALKVKVNQSVTGMGASFTALAQKGADYFRNKGVYWPVNVAKSIGLKRIIFGKDTGSQCQQDVPHHDLALLRTSLMDEKRKLEDLLGEDIGIWSSSD